MTASIETILRSELGLGKWQTTFIATLLRLMIALPGRATFRNLARFAHYHERTFRRHFDKAVSWTKLNIALAQPAWIETNELVLAIDASFVPKSGKHTYGLDAFWNGAHSRSERGLEVSLLALIEPETKRALALSAQQTEARVPDKAEPDKASVTASRTAQYLAHLQLDAPQLPERVRYVVADGYYAKQAFIDGVRALDRHMIGKLRCDANLRHLYTGARTGKPGRPRLYAGKVNLDDPEQLTYVAELDPGVHLYTGVVNHKHFKRSIRLAYLLDARTPNRPRRKLLFSTDPALSAQEVIRLYSARFQIEFLFRDAKQHTGLSASQTRSQKRLAFHFNASFAALNLAKREAYRAQDKAAAKDRAGCRVFSMASAKRRGYNALYLNRIMETLDVAAERVLNQATYERLCSFGAIAD